MSAFVAPAVPFARRARVGAACGACVRVAHVRMGAAVARVESGREGDEETVPVAAPRASVQEDEEDSEVWGVGRARAMPREVLDCVVKVYCTHCSPNYTLPWAMEAQRASTSSGFVIEGRRIITNAHSVEHGVAVFVKRRYSDRKFVAEVVAIGNECDIALLRVADEGFWCEEGDEEGGFLVPGPLPKLQDLVAVVGYPSPGNQICVTAGVSSRVEMQQYVHGQGELLAVQIDAAINAGNSGGCVVNTKNQVIGIAFQSIDPQEADGIGYFIPMVVCQHFLDDIERHKRYTGFPTAGWASQSMENEDLRRALRVPKGESGVLVKSVAPTSDAARVLKKGDVVIALDGIPLSNSGTVPLSSGERISCGYLITSHFTHDTMGITILRSTGEGGERERIETSYTLPGMGENKLVQVHDARHGHRRQPEYICYGGLLFQSVSEPFLQSAFGRNFSLEAPVRLIDLYFRGVKTADRTEVVVLSQILSSRATQGYEDDDGNDVSILLRVNGVAVRNLRHLADLIDKSDESVEFVSFELDNEETIIISKSAVAKESQSILETHCIPAARSLGSRICTE